MIYAAENYRSTKQITINPAFELAYWRYGLKVACDWRERLGLPENKAWKRVLENLAPLPVEEGVYVMYEGVEEMWTRFNNSHTDVIGPGAFLPDDGSWVVRHEGLKKHSKKDELNENLNSQ